MFNFSKEVTCSTTKVAVNVDATPDVTVTNAVHWLALVLLVCSQSLHWM
jgi:hypothetical protein